VSAVKICVIAVQRLKNSCVKVLYFGKIVSKTEIFRHFFFKNHFIFDVFFTFEENNSQRKKSATILF